RRQPCGPGRACVGWVRSWWVHSSCDRARGLGLHTPHKPNSGVEYSTGSGLSTAGVTRRSRIRAIAAPICQAPALSIDSLDSISPRMATMDHGPTYDCQKCGACCVQLGPYDGNAYVYLDKNKACLLRSYGLPVVRHGPGRPLSRCAAS